METILGCVVLRQTFQRSFVATFLPKPWTTARLSARRHIGRITSPLGHTSEPEEKSQKKRKRGVKRTKGGTKGLESAGIQDTAEDTASIKLEFPFKGTLNKRDTIDTHNIIQPSTQFTVHRQKSISDKCDARKYIICKGDEVFCFPSVTTVLSCTLPKKRNFMLSMWKKGIMKEFGEEGYHHFREEIKANGNKFHLELESQLYRPNLLSIKPREPLPSSPTQLAPSPRTVSSLPPPLPYPPNYCSGDAVNEVSSIGTEKADGDATIANGGVLTSRESVADLHSGTKEAATKSAGFLESVKPVLTDIGEVYALESVVAHLDLGYSGTCDCIATYRGCLCLIDWKTSSKPRPSISDLHDYPLQAVAYAGAINQDPHYPFKIENLLIVTAYPSGDPCHSHLLTSEVCETYWNQWLLRLAHYQTLFSSDLSDACF